MRGKRWIWRPDPLERRQMPSRCSIYSARAVPAFDVQRRRQFFQGRIEATMDEQVATLDFLRTLWRPLGFGLEGLRYATRVYEKTATGRARDASQELHHARRPTAPQRRAPLSAHQGTSGRDGG